MRIILKENKKENRDLASYSNFEPESQFWANYNK